MKIVKLLLDLYLKKNVVDEKIKKECDHMSNAKKVLIVDDSAFMRKVISDIIERDPRCEAIGTAADGKEALEKVQSLKPDVISLDICLLNSVARRGFFLCKIVG